MSMNISERIKRIRGYFRFLNVTEDASYILVSFPDTWEVPNSMDDGAIQTKRDKQGYYFAIDGSDDIDTLFESIESVIEYNKDMEQKAELLIKKIQELKEIFETEELDKLNKMEFSFGTSNFQFKKKNNKEATEKSKTEEKVETSSMMEVANEIIKEENA